MCFYYWCVGRVSDTLEGVNYAKLLLLFLLSGVAVSAAPSNSIQFTDAPPPRGSTSSTTAGGRARSFCPRRSDPAARSSTPTATAGPTSCSSTARTGQPDGHALAPALYRNNKNGTFTDVTAGSGLDVEMYGMGVAVGDFDNDGRDDVYITALEGDRLFHNDGHFKFRDVTKASGIATRTSARARRGWTTTGTAGSISSSPTT